MRLPCLSQMSALSAVSSLSITHSNPAEKSALREGPIWAWTRSDDDTYMVPASHDFVMYSLLEFRGVWLWVASWIVEDAHGVMRGFEAQVGERRPVTPQPYQPPCFRVTLHVSWIVAIDKVRPDRAVF